MRREKWRDAAGARRNSQLCARTPSCPPPVARPPPPGRSSLKRLLLRASSPPSRNSPVRSGGSSPSLSLSINGSPAGKASPKVHGDTLSEGIVSIRSLDELFSGTTDSQASSGSDFRVNVLSLADLAPSMASQKEGLASEARVMEASGSLSLEVERNLFFADTQNALKPPSATVGEAAALEEEPEETEISEQLSGSSAVCSSGEQENPTSAQYSEDFNSLSENTPGQSPSEESWDGREASPQAGLSDPSSPCWPPGGTQKSQSARRITTKEVAVQTDSSSLMPRGLKTAAAAAAPMDWIVEGTTSPAVSLDVREELTAYRPAVSAFDDMLKQNLLLIQQFTKISRHLHLSFVALLEEEEFHYHTLEETKKYIDHHKHPPLTLQQALHKLEEQKQVAV